MALNETSPDRASDSAATVRMRSWLRRVSARRGLTDPVVIVAPCVGSLVAECNPRRLTYTEVSTRCEADCNPLASPGEADEYPVQLGGRPDVVATTTSHLSGAYLGDPRKEISGHLSHSQR
jgi:hypothetical protein